MEIFVILAIVLDLTLFDLLRANCALKIKDSKKLNECVNERKSMIYNLRVAIQK